MQRLQVPTKMSLKAYNKKKKSLSLNSLHVKGFLSVHADEKKCYRLEILLLRYHQIELLIVF